MIQLRRADERGHFDHGWLNTFHTFSFGDYFDQHNMGYRDLRVINEDFVQGGKGFPRHGHQDMEIITYVLSGALEHKDSLGNGSIIKPGDLQHMSAGRGVLHSEFNNSKSEIVHLLQIWILPKQKGIAPAYQQKAFSRDDMKNKLLLTASPDGAENSLKINQDAKVYSSLLEAKKSVSHSPPQGHGTWIQVAKGSLNVLNNKVQEGDGVAIEKEATINIEALTDAEFLLFDLP